MKEELTEIGVIKTERNWLPIIGGIGGGLIGLAMVLIGLRWIAFSIVNASIIGALIGSFYGLIYKKNYKLITVIAIIGGIFGGLSGFQPELLFIFAFTAPYVLLFYVYLIFNKGFDEWVEDCIGWYVGARICTITVALLTIILSRGKGGAREIIGRLIASFIPFLDIGVIFEGGYYIDLAWIYSSSTITHLTAPYFAIPFLSFAGYFIACKISEPKKSREYIKKTREGGFLMAKDRSFSQEIGGDISPVAFSEKAMMNDLLGALNNRNLFLTKLDSWKARAKAKDQLRAFEMIKEMIEKETGIVKASTEYQQALLDHEKLRGAGQHLQRQQLKTQLLEELYKQTELEHKTMKRQQKIEELKRQREAPESEIERLKREELEKIDFQEEILKLKTVKLSERMRLHMHLIKKIKDDYSPEQAERMIDEFRRMMVEEGLT